MHYVISEFIATLKDWPIGTILAILIALGILTLITLGVIGVFRFIDSWKRPIKIVTGRVVEKNYTERHTQFVMINKTLVPLFVDDDWSVTVAFMGMQDSLSISQELYNALTINTIVKAGITQGRFSNNYYLQSVDCA